MHSNILNYVPDQNYCSHSCLDMNIFNYSLFFYVFFIWSRKCTLCSSSNIVVFQSSAHSYQHNRLISIGESLTAGKKNGQQTVLCMPWLSTLNQNLSLIKANQIGHCQSDTFGLDVRPKNFYFEKLIMQPQQPEKNVF